MGKRKTRPVRAKLSRHKYLDFNEGVREWYEAKFQVRIFRWWFTFNTIKDYDEQYIENRARELMAT